MSADPKVETAQTDEDTYCGAELGEVRSGECGCPRCEAGYPDPLQDWPMPGHLRTPPAPASGGDPT